MTDLEFSYIFERSLRARPPRTLGARGALGTRRAARDLALGDRMATPPPPPLAPQSSALLLGLGMPRCAVAANCTPHVGTRERIERENMPTGKQQIGV